jgi:hypothetical protein
MYAVFTNYISNGESPRLSANRANHDVSFTNACVKIRIWKGLR